MRFATRRTIPPATRSVLMWVAIACGAMPFPAVAAEPAPVPSVPAAAPPIVMIPPPPPVLHVVPALTADQIKLLARMLSDAAGHGLPGRIDANPPADAGQLVEAAMEQARALRGGRLQPDDFLYEWGLRPPPFDPWPGFLAAVQANRLAAWIASLPPPYTGYDGLRRGLAVYRALAAKGGWRTIASGPELAVGASGPRVVALRKRLAIEDMALADVAGVKFDAALAEAVKRAQKRYGLNPTGTVAGETLAALNVPADQRVAQIVANMERWRWLPPALAKERIQVNIAAAVLTVFDADAPVASMRAATGRPGDETPMLQSTIYTIVLNPPWNVPSSIATKELWPKEKASPGYLAKNGYKVIDLPDGNTRLQQKPGPQSALGRVKFDFDNPYSVYLHDTPAQSAFGRYQRLVSHGCVRLERPLALAQLVLRDDPAWQAGMLDAAVAARKTQRVSLPRPMAVYLLYWTAFASANGQINFRADPYDWDRILAAKVDAFGGRPRLVLTANKGGE